MTQYLTIWEYKVKVPKMREFEKLYGPAGEWVKLFSTDDNYIKTELHKDINDPYRFVTIDYWKSKEAYYSFRNSAKKDFEIIDKAGEELTEIEAHLGEFFSSQSKV